MAVEKIYARNTVTGQEREFSKFVFDELIDIIDSRGLKVARGGWVVASRPTEKPTAAIEAEKKAAELEERKAAAKKDFDNKMIIQTVEAKVIQESAKIDFKTELLPYLEAKGWTELGSKPVGEIVIELRARLAKKA